MEGCCLGSSAFGSFTSEDPPSDPMINTGIAMLDLRVSLPFSKRTNGNGIIASPPIAIPTGFLISSRYPPSMTNLPSFLIFVLVRSPPSPRPVILLNNQLTPPATPSAANFIPFPTTPPTNFMPFQAALARSGAIAAAVSTNPRTTEDSPRIPSFNTPVSVARVSPKALPIPEDAA